MDGIDVELGWFTIFLIVMLAIFIGGLIWMYLAWRRECMESMRWAQLAGKLSVHHDEMVERLMELELERMDRDE